MTGMKRQPPRRDPPRGENTVEFRLKDPRIDMVARLADDRPSSLERYRRFFSDYQLRHTTDPAGLNFDIFIRNIRAGSFITLGSQEVDLFFTSSAAFLVFTDIPEFGFLKERFPSIDFTGKLSIAEHKSGGSPIALIRLTGPELSELLSGRTHVVEQELSDQMLSRVRAMLADRGTVSSASGFDPADFSRRMAVCQALDDGTGQECYFVALDGDDSAYTLSTEPESAFGAFTYRGSVYYLKRQELI